MKTRKDGFTLVELLIVIMIIAILSGMMLLATGSATDNAEAVKVVNDLRNLKSAALLYYGDHLAWPTQTNVAALNNYSDRPIVKTSSAGRYSVSIGTEYSDTVTGSVRTNIGITLTGAAASLGVQTKLANKAADTGMLANSTSATTPYTTGTQVWMNMR
jgi:general secretion pathway protein G